MKDKKTYERPLPFPKGDTRWQNYFDINRYGKAVWLYHNEEGEVIFGVIRHDKPNNEKSIFQFSYCYDETGKLDYYKSNAWKKDKPLFNVHLLKETTKDVIIPEGEKACVRASELLPEYFITTWSGGCKNWKHTNWETLKGRNVIFWPDNDEGGKEASNEIARYLNDKFDIKAKVVDLPDNLPIKFDLADPIPEDLDYRDLIQRAEVPDPKGMYEDIDEDITNKRWVYIQDTLKLYWDRKRKQLVKKETINLLYKRNRKKIGLAESYLHENDIDVVDGTAYWPLNKEILHLDNKTYLNSFRPVFHEPLIDSELKDFSLNDIEHWRNHIRKVLCNDEEIAFNYLEDTIAHDLQYPHENRTFAWLFSSKQGVGKSVFFKLITKLHGFHNVAWVSTDNLVDKYRSFMKHCHVIICNEIDISGQGKSAKLDKLKELITEDIHPIEQKYVDTVNHRGHYRLYASSNKTIPFNLDPNDRRVSYVNINLSKDEVEKDDPEYFEKLWAQVNDDNFIRKIYHYYNNVHKISKSFNKNKPITTESKRELMNVSKPQIFKDLDEFYLLKIGPFANDVVATRDIIEYLRLCDEQEGKRPIFQNVSESQIHDWLNSINAKAVWKKQPVSLIGDRKRNRKRYHAIRNKDYWYECSDISLLRLHVEGKFSVKHGIQQELELSKVVNDEQTPF